MPTFECFDRLEPDLTLSEIIDAARKRKLKFPKKEARGPYAPDIAARLRKLRESLALTGRVTPKPPVTHMNRSILLRRLTEFDARLGKIVKPREKKVTEFALLPALAGGILGSGLGARAGKKKWNPETGKFEDNPVTSAVGAVAGAGAGYGVGKVHQAVLGNFGGEGGVKEAYRNVARNAAVQAGEKVSGVIGPKATTAIQDTMGIAAAEGEHAFKRLKGAGTRVLKKVFSQPPARLVELEARVDAVLFGKKKPEAPVKKAVTELSARQRLTNFVAQVEQPKKKFNWPLAAGVGLAGAGTVAAVRAAGPVKAMVGGAMEGIRARRVKPNFKIVSAPYGPSVVRVAKAAGASIPPDKVHEFLLALHKTRMAK